MTPIDPHALGQVLNDLLACETRGLLRHLREAQPYLTPATLQAWRDMNAMGRRSAARADQLTGLLALLGQPERPAAFPVAVAQAHFLTVPGVAPALLEETRRQIAGYERALALAGNDPRLAPPLHAMLDQQRAFLERLLRQQTTRVAHA